MSQIIRNGVAAPRCALRCATADKSLETLIKAKRMRSRHAGLLFLALCAATVGLTTFARAEIIQIPAIAFQGRSDVEFVGDASFGVLTNAKGTFYAPVPFPASGQVVCRFVLVHRDNDDLDITARLMKKRINVGGNPFVEPEPFEMASAQTTGATAGVEKLVDRSVKQRVIDLLRAFYYVELTVPGTLLEVLGVQIDVRPAC